MPNIRDYVETTRVVLAESAKYFTLLLFAVLAIRLWRRAAKAPQAKRLGNILLASSISLLTSVIGYFSVCHSMSLMYLHFGMQAFHSYKLQPAFVLFQTSASYWKNPDAIGGQGVCLLWTGNPRKGLQLLNEAKKLRDGKGSPFEDFYEGLYYFYQNDVTNAVPLLEWASADPVFAWDVTKLFAAIQLDRGQPQEAAKLMQPFMQIPVTDPDQAYVVASLKLAEGKTNEAQALVDQFVTNNPMPFWKTRLEKVRAKIERQTP
jgi:hypothetical protein